MPRILLVEDDPDVSSILTEVLEDAGYEVESSHTLGGGTALLDNNKYDLVIADIGLPDGNGVTLAIRAGERGIPSLIVTGDAQNLRIDAYAVIEKPFRAHALLAATRRVLGKI